MAGIKQPIQDILARLKTIQATNLDGVTGDLYARVWNNQIEMSRDGKTYIFPRPAAFVEIINNPQFQILGGGFRTADLGFRIHLVHDFYDAQDGTFEQDLTIFDLRDKILSNTLGLSGYVLTACSPLNCMAEEQDYEHDNMYHYILDFVCNFIDSKGSPYDPDAGQYTEETVPDLDVVAQAEFKSDYSVTAPETDPYNINPNFIR